MLFLRSLWENLLPFILPSFSTNLELPLSYSSYHNQLRTLLYQTLFPCKTRNQKPLLIASTLRFLTLLRKEPKQTAFCTPFMEEIQPVILLIQPVILLIQPVILLIQPVILRIQPVILLIQPVILLIHAVNLLIHAIIILIKDRLDVVRFSSLCFPV